MDINQNILLIVVITDFYIKKEFCLNVCSLCITFTDSAVKFDHREYSHLFNFQLISKRIFDNGNFPSLPWFAHFVNDQNLCVFSKATRSEIVSLNIMASTSERVHLCHFTGMQRMPTSE